VPALGFPARFAALRLAKHYCAGRHWGGKEREFINHVQARLREKVKAVP
jgi:hypothetical protein